MAASCSTACMRFSMHARNSSCTAAKAHDAKSLDQKNQLGLPGSQRKGHNKVTRTTACQHTTINLCTAQSDSSAAHGLQLSELNMHTYMAVASPSGGSPIGPDPQSITQPGLTWRLSTGAPSLRTISMHSAASPSWAITRCCSCRVMCLAQASASAATFLKAPCPAEG